MGVAVRFMDNVVDVSNYPLEQQAAEALAKRRIGLGMTGLADALAMCGLRYGSAAAAEAADTVAKIIENAAYRARSNLAAEKGAFPLFNAEAYLKGGHAAALPEDIRAGHRRTASATRCSPRSRPPAPSRSSPAMCRAASSPSSA